MDKQDALRVIRYLAKEFDINLEVKPQEVTNPKDEIQIVIDYLNEKTNSKYLATSSVAQKDVKARIKEYSVEDCKYVIDVKCKEWLGTNMEKFLRPSTLFRKSKFEEYVNEKRQVSPLLNFFTIKED